MMIVGIDHGYAPRWVRANADVVFADREAPYAYTQQLLKLFRKFDAPTDGLVAMGASDFYERSIRSPIARRRRWVKSLLG